MGDEFSSLAGGGGAASAVPLFVCRDEDEVRQQAVAMVNAAVSREALEDEAAVKKATEAVQNATNTVMDLKQKLEQASLHPSANPPQSKDGISGVAILATSPSAAEANPNSPVVLSAEALAFRLRSAQRELKLREEALFKLQSQVRRRQAERLRKAQEEEAKAAQQAQIEAARMRQAFADRHADRRVALASSGPSAAGGDAAATVPRRPAIRPLSQLPLPTGAGTAARPAAPRTPAAVPPQPTQRSSKMRMTLREYRGGDLLPSVNRVNVSGVKQIRYEDDTSLEAFAARLAKREKLEALQHAALIKEEEEDEKPGSEEEEVKPEREEVQVKKDKVENPNDGGGGGGDPHSRVVIDVDALMEMEEEEVQDVLEHLHVAPAPAAQRGDGGGEVRRKGRTRPRGDLVPEPPPPTELIPLPHGMTIPASIYHRLLDFQQEGLHWLLQLHAQRVGGILGDEMGLGKTIQVAALICALSTSHQLYGPILLVSPVTVIRQWVVEMHRWSPRTRVLVLHQPTSSSVNPPKPRELVDMVRGLSNAVVITSYVGMRRHCDVLQTAGFHYVILDEGHKISNPAAGVTLAAKAFPTPHRLILSGSPIQNSLKELWCLFDFVRPGLLGSLPGFTTEFDDVIGKSKNARASPLMLSEAVEAAKVLQQRISPYLLRRLKREVNAELPEKYEKVIYVPLSDEQLQEYVNYLASPNVQSLISQLSSYTLISGGLNRDMRDSTGSLHVAGRSFNIKNRQQMSHVRVESFRVLYHLRQICNHVDIFRFQNREGEGLGDGEEDDVMYMDLLRAKNAGAPTRDRQVGGTQPSAPKGSRSFRSNLPVNLGGSAKLQTLRLMLTEWKQGGHRALLFSQTRMMLDIIENMVETEGHRYVRMDGTTPISQRQNIMDRFNQDDSVFLALLTTRVGGVGLNLTGADRVVIFDPDWNPTTDAQARERAWRVGQRRDVCVYRLITLGAVEEFIFKRQLAKGYVTDKVLRDPTYQRFFLQESFTEGMLLGGIYDARVPESKKHVLLNRDAGVYHSSGGSPTSSFAAGQPPDEGGDGTNQVGGELVVHFDEFGMERRDGVGSGGEGNSDVSAFELDLVASPLKEEEWEEEEEEEGEGGDGKGDKGRRTSSSSAARHRCGPHSPTNDGEQLSVLRNLVDGATVHEPSHDIAQRLAALQAQQRMQRVSETARSRSFAQQQNEFKRFVASEVKREQ